MTRTRASFLTVTQQFNLQLACRPLWLAGFSVYLVGSCLNRPDYRDVDLRAIMSDEEHQAFSQGFRMRVALFNTTTSEWLSSRSGLPVDFQLQSGSEADLFEGERQAIGIAAGEWREPH